MKKLMAITLTCFALAVSAFAQGNQTKATDAKPAGALPSVDQVLDKYVQALGGKAALEKFNSRLEKGTVEMPAMGLSGPIEIYTKAPNKTFLTIEFPGMGSFQRGFNGATGWEQNPGSGTREMTGEELAQSKLAAMFHRNTNLKQLYPKMEVKGIEKVADRDAYVIEATPASGGPEKMYFDTQTGLLVRSDQEAVTEQGKFPVTSFLEDYKEVDGIKLPFTVRQNSPVASFTIKLTEVKHNITIEDKKFDKP